MRMGIDMNTEQERADFEAWFKESDHYLSKLDFCLMPDGRYEDDDVEVAWEAYQAGRAALQSQPNIEATEWLKQHEALMHRVSKAALVVGYGGTINGSAAEQTLENAEKALLDHARALQSQDREDSGKLQEAARDMFVRASEIEVLYGTNKETEGLVQAAMRLAYLASSTEKTIDHARRIEGGGE